MVSILRETEAGDDDAQGMQGSGRTAKGSIAESQAPPTRKSSGCLQAY